MTISIFVCFHYVSTQLLSQSLDLCGHSKKPSESPPYKMVGQMNINHVFDVISLPYQRSHVNFFRKICPIFLESEGPQLELLLIAPAWAKLL